MTLFKQLLILISALFLMIFVVNFATSVNNIKSYLEVESEVHAQDTATSLGLSLSPYMAKTTDPIIATMMSAIFDAGYYREIKLADLSGQTLIALNNDQRVEGVPQWFVELLPMKTAIASSEISAGWTIAGTVSVTINPGYAYLKLFQQAQSALSFSLAALVLSVLMLFFLLRYILRPLKNIDVLARSIAEGKFAFIDKLPWTTEIRNVAVSMNFMSEKIAGVIKNLNTKLEVSSNKLYLDELTELPRKSVFMTDMKRFHRNGKQGYLVLIKIETLAEWVKSDGNQKVDDFLVAFADVLREIVQKSDFEGMSTYRFIGAEFAILAPMPDQGQIQIQQLAELITLAMTRMGTLFGRSDIGHIGITPFDFSDTVDSILAASNEAYEQAKLIGANQYFVRESPEQGKSLSQWKPLVFDIIDNKDFKISLAGAVTDFKADNILMQEAVVEIVDQRGNALPLGTFISIAEEFGKVVGLDKAVITGVIEAIEEQGVKHAIAVNLSMVTLQNGDFRIWLIEQFKQHPGITRQLVFSISAYAAAKDINGFTELSQFVHSYQSRVMLKRYESQFISLDSVKQFKPDFIRLTRDLTHEMDKHQDKVNFVETMKEFGDLLDIIIFAENVKQENDVIMLMTIGIAGVSR